MTSTPPRPLAAAVVWLLVFAAVLGHLPAIGFDFAQDDFASLARAAGLDGASPAQARPWTSQVTWQLMWPAFGIDPAPYHVVSLLLLALIAVLTARVTHRLGGSDAGAAIAGLLVLLGPTTALPIAWVSASAELWAVMFALAALDRWLAPATGAQPLVGAVFAVLSVLSKEPALALFLLLPLAAVWFVPGEPGRVRRGRWVLVAIVGAVAVWAGWTVRANFAHGPQDAYALGTPLDALTNLLRMTTWAAWPWAGALPPRELGVALGAGIVVGLGALAVVRARSGDRRVLFLVLLLVSSLAPTAPLRDHTYAYYALLAGVCVAAIAGIELGPRLARLDGRRGGLALVGATALTVFVGWTGVSTRVDARGTDGLLDDPILRRSSIVADVRSKLAALAASPAPPRAIGVLQASRVPVSDDLLTTDEIVFLGSPVYVALRGDLGLDLLSGPDVHARWITHVDDVPPEGFVFLDSGAARLMPLGPPENAQVYTAMIAVAGGQFERARHDLWSVIAAQGTQVRFAFDPAVLPIRPEELDAEADDFARWLVARVDDPTNTRILRLFEQLYEHVRGKELVRDIDELARPPRFD